MLLTEFITQACALDNIRFQLTMDVIDLYYHYTPTAFTNGQGADAVNNEAGMNEGACKIFAFARLHGLDEKQTLHLFGDFYYQAVLQDPEGDSHQNIRQFMQSGWQGIRFDAEVLQLK